MHIHTCKRTVSYVCLCFWVFATGTPGGYSYFVGNLSLSSLINCWDAALFRVQQGAEMTGHEIN